jgi:hypothetical protein
MAYCSGLTSRCVCVRVFVGLFQVLCLHAQQGAFLCFSVEASLGREAERNDPFSGTTAHLTFSLVLMQKAKKKNRKSGEEIRNRKGAAVFTCHTRVHKGVH